MCLSFKVSAMGMFVIVCVVEEKYNMCVIWQYFAIDNEIYSVFLIGLQSICVCFMASVIQPVGIVASHYNHILSLFYFATHLQTDSLFTFVM